MSVIWRLSPENDVVIVEVGGTVGDIESLPFLEAIRQFRATMLGRENAIFVHLTLMPYIAAAGRVEEQAHQHRARVDADRNPAGHSRFCAPNIPSRRSSARSRSSVTWNSAR
jgi:hypothetical protein